MKVTVAIPTYNRGYIIENCLNYVCKQNYHNLEVLVVDNCSTDNTQQIVQSFILNNGVKYFRQSTNVSLINNWNFTLRYATGDFIIFVPDDDILINADYISRAIQLIKQYNLNWIAAGSISVDAKTNRCKKYVNSKELIFKNIDFFKFHKWGYDNFAALTIIINRQKALDAGGYSINLYNFDLELLFKLSLEGNAMILNSIEALYGMSIGQSNYLIDPYYMFAGYMAYYNLQQYDIDEYNDKLVVKNIKDYFSACFRYFLDRDAFGEIEFDDEYWLTFCKNIDNNRFYPFFDEDCAERYAMFKSDKNAFAKHRKNIISTTWVPIADLAMINFMKLLNTNV